MMAREPGKVYGH